jgi:membrane protease YdiL (CAAX protease family)
LLDLTVWLVLVVGLTLGVTLLSRAPGGGPPAILAAPAQMILLFLATSALLARRGEGWGSLGLFKPIRPGRAVALVGLGYLAAIGLNALMVLLVFPHLGLARPNFGAFGAIQGRVGGYLSWLLVAWSSAAIGEELQFRGFLWSRLERLYGEGPGATRGALVTQAALFGLGHLYQGPAGVLVTGVLGLVLGTVYLAGRRSLLPCMLLHALIDTISLTALFFFHLPGGPS